MRFSCLTRNKLRHDNIYTKWPPVLYWQTTNLKEYIPITSLIIIDSGFIKKKLEHTSSYICSYNLFIVFMSYAEFLIVYLIFSKNL